MPNFFEWNTLGWRDVVDVVLVAVVLYYILLAIRGTRAVQILLGIVIMLGLQALSFYLKLQSTYFVIRGLVLSVVVALPVVFQPELRRALMQLGGSMKFQHVRHDVLVKIVDEIARAANVLSQTRTGALIAVERETGLEEYVENGVEINAEISGRLLLSLFQKTSPLHDGAVILRGDKVVAASCYLPLSEARVLGHGGHAGTRHRAALGLSEQTDAAIIVVSEETGEISIVQGGKFSHHDNEESLKRHLLERLQPAPPPGVATPAQLRAWMSGRLRGRNEAATAPPTTVEAKPAERTDALPLPRALPSEAPALDEEAIAEKQRQIEKAVEARASEARRREERRKDDESRKPEADEPHQPTSSSARDSEPHSTDAAPPSASMPRPPHATPAPSHVEDRLQERQ